VSPAATHFYIYYRVAQQSAEQARRELAALMHTLERQTGIIGRLLQREDEATLWMEVYEDVRDSAAFQEKLDDLIRIHGFARYLAPGSARKTERFVAHRG